MMSLQCGRESSVILSAPVAEIGHYGRKGGRQSQMSGMMSSQVLQLEMTSRFKVEQSKNV
jgi:hypothetical protein